MAASTERLVLPNKSLTFLCQKTRRFSNFCTRLSDSTSSTKRSSHLMVGNLLEDHMEVDAVEASQRCKKVARSLEIGKSVTLY